ncbi:MAG: TIM barrel protein [Armatimonadetes bacterium]|nr:TIM barrel protein [Armatimonadota bacterium]
MNRREFIVTSAMAAAGFAVKPAIAQPEAPRLKQDLCWWCYGSMEPKRLIGEAKRIGYSGLELAPEQHWDDIKTAGLEIVTMGGHASIGNGMNDPKEHARIEDEVAKNIEKAKKYGIPILICFSGNRRGMADEAGIENMAACMKRLAPMAEREGITLALEPLNSKVDHRDYHADTTEWGVKMCKLVGSPRVKLLYDIYHMQIMEGDVIRTIRAQHEFIAHYHTAGNPGRNEIGANQELNYAAVARAIADTGHRGYIGQEFIPKGDPIKGMEEAFRICTV